ncbi:DUF2207 domain-containing protein [Methanobacterium formicicum]|uniref:DUF2207 domain-containing protein n=1 Tax=Methanobacterium formicicum (strain DSM 3637 / PP1) TaxID=1204725 RepID=K2RW80_METFP|nr:DUF2207 domain-containing protein [Methanobacterium formicicum]EKF87020.1 hypothetical protein A994_02000 [Methanobacterium formicicum DSM 3637]
MDKKRSILLIVTLSIFLLSFMGSACAEEDRSYSIPSINMDMFLQNDGSIHVTETIHYSFSGTYNGVYRDIPLKNGQILENVKVSTQGAYSSQEVIDQGTNQRVKIYLYSDAAKTNPISNKDVAVTIEYDLVHVLRFYNDIVQLQYKLVGEGWDVPIEQLNAKIHVPSSDGVKYWLNPPYYAKNSSWQGNTLEVNSESIPSGDYFEIRMVLPKSQFSSNPTNGTIINQDALNQIEQIQTAYQNQLNFNSMLYSILAVLMILSLFVPLIIYYRYGREPKIDYRAEYERDIPTDDPPALVNAICGPGFSKKIGEPDMDGFKATIMDLIDRKYLLMEKEPSEKQGYGIDDSMFLKINPEKDKSALKEFELDILNFLGEFEQDGLISLDQISADLSDRETAKSFRDTYNNWKDDIKDRFLSDDQMDKIFIKKGDTYLKIFGVAGIIVAAIVFFVTITDSLPAAKFALVASIALGVVSVISLILPQKIAGQWTTYGEEYDAKWHNFKKYIQDFSLIKEYPPESVTIWNKYLVYATALGAAEAVRKAMELYVPNEQLEGSDIYMFHYYGGYALLASSLDNGISTASAGSGDFGGVGDIGGGDIGGGGGAF